MVYSFFIKKKREKRNFEISRLDVNLEREREREREKERGTYEIQTQNSY